MSAIKGLPSGPCWSLLKKDNGFSLLTNPKLAWRLFPGTIENILTGERLPYDGISFLEDYLSRKKNQNSQENFIEELWVVHTFYEAGLWWNDNGHQLKSNLSPDTCLGLILEFQEAVEFNPNAIKEGELDISWKAPNPLAYEKAFYRGKDFLMKGDCYQYNLTFPFLGKINKGDISQIITRLWAQQKNIGAYASATVCGDDFYISNTPECLFEWSTDELAGNSILETRPIKGTLSYGEGDDFDKSWEKLCSSEKDESELFMITDLLRNDLNRIEKPRAEVLAKKAPLVVPGLLHSYSHIQVKLSGAVSLLSIIKALFPGGSITGAPKIRVMKIIDQLEVSRRGFYCGSTIYPKDSKIVGSINIRSAQGSLGEGTLAYHAGGGITVQSDWESEYQEMENKFLSFQSLLTSP